MEGAEYVTNKLYRLELLLRRLITAKLSANTDEGWSQHIPDDVFKRIRGAKERDLTRGRPPRNNVEYLEFSHYAPIICYNWDATFKEVFSDEEILKAKLKELKPIRNSHAHSCRISDADRR